MVSFHSALFSLSIQLCLPHLPKLCHINRPMQFPYLIMLITAHSPTSTGHENREQQKSKAGKILVPILSQSSLINSRKWLINLSELWFYYLWPKGNKSCFLGLTIKMKVVLFSHFTFFVISSLTLIWCIMLSDAVIWQVCTYVCEVVFKYIAFFQFLPLLFANTHVGVH